jgi:antitoxin MazE
MITKIQKWGNSLGLRIPKSLAEGAHVREGTTVYLALDKGRLIIKPTGEKVFKLDDLLANVTKENVHDEITTGGPVGKEAW